MRFIVSGSTGIVGRNIVQQLIDNPAGVQQIVSLSRRNRYKYEDHPGRESALLLECYGDLRYDPIRLISQFKPTHIIHCAGIGTQNSLVRDLWEANASTTLNLLEACRVLPRLNFVYTSSIVVDHKPLTPYAASKIAGEKLVESYSSMNDNIFGTTVRFPAVAGAGNKHGVVKAVVDKLLKDDSDTLNLFNNSQKPFVYAKQLAQEIIHISKLDNPFTVYQLCSSDTISVNEIARIAMCLTGLYKDITWQLDWKGDQLFVPPVESDGPMFSSAQAVKFAIADILREEYDYGHGI